MKLLLLLMLLPLPRSSALEENLTAGCNAACGCLRELFNPVCGADAVTYYSPCHAGCRYGNHTQDSTAQRVRGNRGESQSSAGTRSSSGST